MYSIIIVFFISCLIIQLIYYLFVYPQVLKIKRNSKHSIEYPVSVIISAHNECQNLKRFLPLILNQDYEQFEVIVVNDRSVDDTKNILNEFKKRYNNLIVLNVFKKSISFSPKKYALSQAVSYAKYNQLLFTDADCYPVSPYWIKTLMSLYTENKEIVLSYGAYETAPGLLNKLIRFDTLFIAVQYLSFAKIGYPYMGVGRNISYKKELFIKYGGYEAHKEMLSGDDDLFINSAANKINTAVSDDSSGFTRSIPKTSFKTWFSQKRRHLTTGSKYKRLHKLFLIIEPVSKLGFLLCFLVFLFSGHFLLGSFILFFTRYIIIMVFFSLAAKKFQEKKLLIFIPIFELLLPLINLTVLTTNIFADKREWN